MSSNIVELIGMITSKPVISHRSHDEDYYIFNLSVKRLSGAEDIIPIIFKPKYIDMDFIIPGTKIFVGGNYRSYNLHTENRARLILNVYAKEICIFVGSEGINENDIQLNGYICKEPVFRETPMGRKICDILLAVNRKNTKSDYIPCVVWGKSAEKCTSLKIGSNIQLTGRIQSRAYQKKIDDENSVKKTAYEVSVTNIEFKIWRKTDDKI